MPPPKQVELGAFYSVFGARQLSAAERYTTDCRYGGGLGLGHLTSNGHPSGGPWRQLHCTACESDFLETHGTPLHGKRVSIELLVWAVGALAEGLGIRAVARVFEVDPHTVEFIPLSFWYDAPLIDLLYLST